jgi:hypothetical protein
MSKALLDGRQAQVDRPGEFNLGGFDDDGRQVVKKSYSSGKAAEKPEFFMGGCDPTVPTGPKRKLRASWLSDGPAQTEPPPPIATPTKRWTPVNVKKLPPRAASHDGSMSAAGHTGGQRKGRKPFKPASPPEIKADEGQEEHKGTGNVRESDTKETETPRKEEQPTPKTAPRDELEEEEEEEEEELEEDLEEEEAPRQAVKPRVVSPKPRSVSPKPRAPILPKQEGRGVSPVRSVSPIRIATTDGVTKHQVRGTSPVRTASPVKPASPVKTTWQPPTLHIRKPVHPTDDDEGQLTFKDEVSTAPQDAATSNAEKDQLIKTQAEEIKKLRAEKGELAGEIKKMKGSQRMNQELKDEIFELKQQLSKKEQSDANSKGFHKLENKLNTLKMVMDGKVNKQSLEDLQEHVAFLNMLINQDLKKEGMKNVWI